MPNQDERPRTHAALVKALGAFLAVEPTHPPEKYLSALHAAATDVIAALVPCNDPKVVGWLNDLGFFHVGGRLMELKHDVSPLPEERYYLRQLLYLGQPLHKNGCYHALLFYLGVHGDQCRNEDRARNEITQMRCAARDLLEIVESKKQRPEYDRDHLWLAWSDAGMKPAGIRDRWNREHPEEAIEELARGRDVVNKALARARGERDAVA